MAAYAAPPSEAAQVELPSHATRKEWFEDWEEKTRDARNLSRRDRWYYDNVQWTSDEVAELEARGQPVITKNRIARKINGILGEEIEKRVDPVARPRTPQHEDGARAMTDALRYVEEEQGFDGSRSAVLKDALIEGYGGALKEIEELEDEDWKHVLTHVQWDRLFYDPHSRSPDFTDGKYNGLILWMDLDDAIERWPDAEDALRAALSRDVGNSDNLTEDVPRRWGDRRRNRVKIVEMYFRVGKDFYRGCFTEGADLEEPARTAYLDEKGKHSVNPLVMMSCYVDSDGMRYGVVRSLISPQDEINKRTSKSLWAISVTGVIAEEGAVLDPQKFQTEMSKPDGFAEVQVGALQDGRVQPRKSVDMAQGDIQLLQEAKLEIDTIGPSSANLPEIPESASGRAFIARQKAASRELGPVFDSLRRWDLAVFTLDYLCIRWRWTREKWLRVTDDEEETGYRFVALNRQVSRAERFQELVQKQVPPPNALQTAAGDVAPRIMAELQQMMQQIGAQAQQMGQQPPPIEALIVQHPLMQEVITENQVDQLLADIVLDEAPETSVLAQEEFETLSEIFPVAVQARPDMAPVLVKSLIKASHLPARIKRDIVKEMDKGPDPQQQQQQQQIQQLQTALQQAQVALTQAQGQAAGSQAQLNAARAAQVNAEAQAALPQAQADISLTQAQAAKTAAEAQAVPAKTRAEIEARTVSSAKTLVDASEPKGASVAG